MLVLKLLYEQHSFFILKIACKFIAFFNFHPFLTKKEVHYENHANLWNNQ